MSTARACRPAWRTFASELRSAATFRACRKPSRSAPRRRLGHRLGHRPSSGEDRTIL